MNRWKASSVHLLLSFLIIGGIATSALLLWYPHHLYRIAGFDRLLLIMLGIDLTAGPLLTCVVYKPNKPSLRFDLTVIGLFQLAFLAYGLHTLWAARPVFLVASDMRFNLVFANEIDPQELAKARRPEWRRLSWTGPVLVGVAPPASEKERADLLFAFLASGVDIDKLPRYYLKFDAVAPQLLANAKQQAQKANEGRPVVPVVSRFDTAWMALDERTGQPITLVDQPKHRDK